MYKTWWNYSLNSRATKNLGVATPSSPPKNNIHGYPWVSSASAACVTNRFMDVTRCWTKQRHPRPQHCLQDMAGKFTVAREQFQLKGEQPKWAH